MNRAGRSRAARAEGDWRIEPLGDRCLIVEFESRVDAAINRRARSLADALLADPVPGVLDVVPAFCSVAVYYRPELLVAAMHPSSPPPSPYQALRARVQALLAGGTGSIEAPAREIRIPVCYGGIHGPDLEEVAAACSMTADEVVLAHVASEHLVYMLGFSPGFPYIGGLDPRLAVPRRSTPRTRIPAGTVAIARDQTAIYSFETPGGWNLIGRTPLGLFDPQADPPCRLQAGDRIRFVPIAPEEFRKATPTSGAVDD
jgi:inhibitor of KinA